MWQWIYELDIVALNTYCPVHMFYIINTFIVKTAFPWQRAFLQILRLQNIFWFVFIGTYMYPATAQTFYSKCPTVLKYKQLLNLFYFWIYENFSLYISFIVYLYMYGLFECTAWCRNNGK